MSPDTPPVQTRSWLDDAPPINDARSVNIADFLVEARRRVDAVNALDATLAGGRLVEGDHVAVHAIDVIAAPDVNDLVEARRRVDVFAPDANDLVARAREAELKRDEVRREAARKAAATRAANRKAALDHLAEGDTVDTAEFVTLIRDWARRKNLCTSLEVTLQRHLGLRFYENVIDPKTGNYNDKDRLALTPNNPKTLNKAAITKAVRLAKRDVGTYFNDSLEKIIVALNLPDLIEYDDVWEVTATRTLGINASRLRRYGYTNANGEITEEEVRRYARDYSTHYENPQYKFTMRPDPRRPSVVTPPTDAAN